MKRVAVTGGAGFVGTNLVRKLVEKGYQVIAIDDFSTGVAGNLTDVPCEVVKASINDLYAMRSALKGSDLIFHLAARGSVPRSLKNPRATLETNVGGTLNVLECAREYGASVVFSSSSSVYGSNIELPKRERMWTSPLTPYAASKLAGEGLIQSYAHSFDIQSINFRFFNIFGPWQRPDHDYAAVIPRWIWKLINHQNTIEVFGDGSQSRDFTYIDSVTDVLITGLESDLNHPEPLNLAFGERITLNFLIETLRKHFPEIKVKHLDARPGDVRDSQNDPSELRRTFPNVASIPFEIAIQQTIDWFLKHGHKIANGPKILD